jgi:hypothetical protein
MNRALVILCLLLASCADRDARLRIDAMQRQLDALAASPKVRAEPPASRVRDELARSSAISAHLATAIASRSRPRTIVPGAGDHRPGPASLMVVRRSTEPTATGARLVLLVGNPYQALISGYTLTLRHGRAMPRPPAPDASPADLAAGLASMAAWEKSLRTVELSSSDTIAPGSWSTASVLIEPCPAGGLDHLDVETTVAVVGLRGAE